MTYGLHLSFHDLASSVEEAGFDVLEASFASDAAGDFVSGLRTGERVFRKEP
jgi:hypothetical protein